MQALTGKEERNPGNGTQLVKKPDRLRNGEQKLRKGVADRRDKNKRKKILLTILLFSVMCAAASQRFQCAHDLRCVCLQGSSTGWLL